MKRLVCLLFFCFPLLVWADEAENQYKKGLAAFSKKDWKEAIAFLSKALDTLKLPPSPTPKQKALFEIGRADIFYHIAIAEKEQNLLFSACKRFQQIDTTVSGLPPAWRTWSLPPRLSSQFFEASSLLQNPCSTLPSPVSFLYLPPKSTLQIRRLPPSAPPAPWQTIPPETSILPGSYEILVQAQGYKDLSQTITVLPWQRSSFPLSLTLLPKERLPPPIRRPDPPPPPTVSPWVWVGVGIAVLAVTGGIIAAVVIAEQNRGIFQPVLRLP